MSCNTFIPIMDLVREVEALLAANYIDKDDPRITGGVFTNPTIKEGFLLDVQAREEFCRLVQECGLDAPFGKMWLSRPLYPDSMFVSYEDSGEPQTKWKTIQAVLESAGVFGPAATSLSSRLAAEIVRSTSADDTHAAGIDNNRRGVEANAKAIALEIQRATSAEGVLTTAVSELVAQDAVLQGQIDGIGGGKLAFVTYAQMQAEAASIAANSSVDVVNDPDPSKNGTYAYDGATFTKSLYDPLTLAKADATAKSDAAKLQAIADAKIYTDSKSESKIDGLVGKNLFDKRKVEAGKGLGDTGTLITAAGRNASTYIAVQPNTAYSFSNVNKAIFYDADKAFTQLSTGANANVTTGASAAFVRVDMTDAQLAVAQIELGELKTAYEPYRMVLGANTVTPAALQDNSVASEKLQTGSVHPIHLTDAVFLNMHNPEKLRTGLAISFADGKTETPSTSSDVTEYIPCRPLTQYAASGFSRVFYYDRYGSFLSIASTAPTFTTPSDCYQMRFQISNLVSARFQVNAGSEVATTQQPHKYKLSKLVVEQSKVELAAITARKYNFSDAYIAWRNGDKFPITFLGDSTTNGNGTTGFKYRAEPLDPSEDYIAPNSYSSVFQALIREATGNTVMRAYNAGFSGQRATWALANLDSIFSATYADTKMVGISFGINDRTANPTLFATNFYRDIEGIIKWCFSKGYQPFLLTTQPTTIPSYTGSASGSDIEEVGNEIKRNLAAKYGLELIDVNKFGQQFMQYSSKPLLDNIMEVNSNVIHFGDAGHKFTAELMFAHFCKRTLWTYNDGERLDYTTQLMKSDINHDQVKQLAVFKQGFKNEVNVAQTTAVNKLYQEFYVFNAGRRQLGITAYYATAAVGQYARINGVQTAITSQGQELGTLGLGLHKIQAYSSATTALDWLGFKLIPQI